MVKFLLSLLILLVLELLTGFLNLKIELILQSISIDTPYDRK